MDAKEKSIFKGVKMTSFLAKGEAFTRNHLVISMYQPVGQEVTEYSTDLFVLYGNYIEENNVQEKSE